jgi:hypothetical protein
MLEILNDIVVEALKPIALEKFLRGRPVSFAMFKAIDVTMVVVGEFVKVDVEYIIAMKTHHTGGEPIMVDHSLK